MATTTKLTEKYISMHPSIKDSLSKGIINYSKLSRMIAKELGIEKQTSMEAILIACRRYAGKIKKDKVQEDKILAVLKKSELEIKNKIVTIIIDKKLYVENLLDIEKKIRKKADMFYAIEGTNVFIVIVSEKYLDELKEIFKKNIIKITKNLAMITIKSGENLESTPGVVSYLYSLFADNGINIVETMSCWTDTIVVVEENDVADVIKFLKF
ncbi:MAG: ACT domain-containing protein [Candidatus Woesearchaeota archaeon]